MPKRKDRRDWIVCDSNLQAFVCRRCGETAPLGLPMEVRAWVKRSQGFAKMHEDCKPKEEADAQEGKKTSDPGRSPKDA